MSQKREIISGAKWTSISTITTALVSILRLSILTRFLDKADFGIVAIITMVLGFTQIFSDLGFSVSIMSQKNISIRGFSSVYWLQFIMFVFIFGVMSLLSPYVAQFYNEQVLTTLLPLALIEIIFGGIGALYDTILQKSYKFKALAFRNILTAIMSLMAALLLALLNFGIYSLIISTLLHKLIFNVWNFVAGQKLMPIKMSFSVADVKPYFKIGINQTGAQILDYISSKFDVLIIGKFWGAEILGVYNLSKELVLRLIYMVNTIANRVMLPFFANNNDNDNYLRTNYCRLIRFLSFVNFPICATMCVFSSYIVNMLYGSEYILESSVLISILSFYAMFICIGNPVGNLSISKGRTDISLHWTIIRVITLPIILYLSAMYSIKVVAISQVFYSIFMFVVGWRMLVYRLINLSFLEYVKSFGGVGVVTLIMILTFYTIVNVNMFKLNNYWIELIVYISTFAFAYIGLGLLLLRKQLLDIKYFT